MVQTWFNLSKVWCKRRLTGARCFGNFGIFSLVFCEPKSTLAAVISALSFLGFKLTEPFYDFFF